MNAPVKVDLKLLSPEQAGEDYANMCVHPVLHLSIWHSVCRLRHSPLPGILAQHWEHQSKVFVISIYGWDTWIITGGDRALRIELFETPQARLGWVQEYNQRRGL